MGLLLRRRERETICIGNDVEVTIVKVEKGQVQLNIQAPRDVSVDRKEIRIRKERGEPKPQKSQSKQKEQYELNFSKEHSDSLTPCSGLNGINNI